MKKILFSVAVLATSFSVNAQDVTIDFESLSLSGTESFYNGSDEAGYYAVGNVQFQNYYFPDFMSWSGFAYSNVTDNTTPGYGNQYSAYPGSGANNSEKYGVFYSSTSKIVFQEPVILQSLKLSNNTYTAISMRDGDPYAKKFGGVSGNDPDFYKVWIIGYNQDFSPADSVEFYLADYRFSDNSLDYIVDTWETITTNFENPIYYLGFKFESSDIGDWGINTPTYLVLDDLAFNKTVSVENKGKLSNQLIYPNPTKEYFKVDASAGTVSIFSTTGKLMFETEISENQIISVSDLDAGSYVVRFIDELGGVSYSTLVKN